MANTPIYGWETPDDTDYVYQGASASRTTANAIDTTVYSLPQGVKSYTLNTTAALDVSTTTETAFFAGPSFTPIAGRLYAVTITIGALKKTTSDGTVTVILRKDSISGTILQTNSIYLLGMANPGILTSTTYYSNTILLTTAQMGTAAFAPHISIQSGALGFMAGNSSTRQGTIIIRDIGPA
jgi:hypothetical protein